MNNIPIVYITDNNYTMPTVVSIISLLKNNNNNKIYVNGIGLSYENKEILKKLNNVKILEFENRYENLKTVNTYVSKAAFFKFELAEILSEYDKILYLDSDTLISGDLADFLNTNIENVYAGVVKDCVGEVIRNDCEKFRIKNYFNSGVMLLNLKKMREEAIGARLLEAKKNSPPDYLDQEIFNIIFQDKVKYLNPDYNYMVTNKQLMQKTVEKFYGVYKIHPKIIHLTHLKPWEYKGVPYSKEWMKYYNLSSFRDKKLKLKENPEKFKIYKKRKFNDRWVVDIFGIRFSYKKGGKDFRVFYP